MFVLAGYKVKCVEHFAENTQKGGGHGDAVLAETRGVEFAGALSENEGRGEGWIRRR